MKRINLFKNKTGKMALSAMQAVGLSAVVGVLGIAAWQMMGSSSDPALNTVFSADDQEVIYVAGAGGGGYASGSYGVGGEVQSGIRARMSDDLRLMQQDAALAGKTDDGLADFERQEQQIQAYSLDGAAEGLGMGANAAKELGVDMGGSLENVQQQMSAVQAALAAQQQAAAAAAEQAGEGDAAQAAAQAALQGQNSRWGMADGMARASGSNLNSTPLQAGHSGEGQGVSSSGVLGGAQSVAGVPGVGGPLEGITAGRRSTSSFGQTLKWQGGDESLRLASLQKQSADIAQNRNRSANEGARAFMSSERLSGGIYIDGEIVLQGNASSSDFSSDNALSALGAAAAGMEKEVLTYEEAKLQLSEDIKQYRLEVAHYCGAFPLLCEAWVWSIRDKTYDKVDQFEEQWGDTDYMKTDTQGNLAEDARVVIRKIWNRSWGGIVTSLTAMYNGQFGKEGDHVFGVGKK